MAQHKSAEKRARSSKRREEHNKAWKSKMRTAIKRVTSATEKDQATEELRKTKKLFDQLAARGVIHRNKAANSKSKLTRYVNNLK
ncbi:MAG: 30S ribosomal protein S20 [Bacteroidota bacterium]